VTGFIEGQMQLPPVLQENIAVAATSQGTILA
jgi:hypothetical protein